MQNFKYNDPSIENPTDKICYKCHSRKHISEFNKCKTGVYGFHNHCRECQKVVKNAWNSKNTQWVKEYIRLPEVRRANSIKRKHKYHNNPEWRKNILERNNTRRRQEPAKIKARAQRQRWISLPHNAIAQNLRQRIRAALQGIDKSQKTEDFLDCSFEHLKLHLESKFQPGMTWENYGAWHIDHIAPCSFFDFSNPEHQKICFHYLNLQPMWARDNISKGGKITIDNISEHISVIKKAMHSA